MRPGRPAPGRGQRKRPAGWFAAEPPPRPPGRSSRPASTAPGWRLPGPVQAKAQVSLFLNWRSSPVRPSPAPLRPPTLTQQPAPVRELQPASELVRRPDQLPDWVLKPGHPQPPGRERNRGLAREAREQTQAPAMQSLVRALQSVWSQVPGQPREPVPVPAQARREEARSSQERGLAAEPGPGKPLSGRHRQRRSLETKVRRLRRSAPARTRW